MKRIEILHTFQHGGQTFHAGEVRVVTLEDAGYFCGLGWATAEGIAKGVIDTSEKTLEVHNGEHLTIGESVNG